MKSPTKNSQASGSPQGRGRRRRLCSYYQFEAFNPFRLPCWRWLRAEEVVVESRAPRRGGEDEWVSRCVAYLLARGTGTANDQARAPGQNFADIDLARRLYEENDVARWLIEAHVLARQPLPEIAQSMSLPAAVVVAYEALYFHVTDRLDARGYILQQTMGKVVRGEVRERDVDVILKLLGYFGGPVVLGAVEHFVLAPGVAPALLPEDQRALAEQTRQFVEVVTMPLTPANVKRLLKEYVKRLKPPQHAASPLPLPSFDEVFAEIGKQLGEHFREVAADGVTGVA